LPSSHSDTQELLSRAERGERPAVARLLAMHRQRLRKMVAIRLDPRLVARADPSDIVQETLIVAHEKLPAYLRDRPIPFYPWLRQIALEQIIRYSRRHVKARARSVLREEQPEPHLSEASAELLAGRLLSSGSRPEMRLERKENQAQVKAALAQLPADYREVLLLRFLEELSLEEVAAVLGTTEGAIRGKQLRALQRLQSLLKERDAGRR
jgi:RNA polymerase sigma-70 factor (ECF subfamily)